MRLTFRCLSWLSLDWPVVLVLLGRGTDCDACALPLRGKTFAETGAKLVRTFVPRRQDVVALCPTQAGPMWCQSFIVVLREIAPLLPSEEHRSTLAPSVQSLQHMHDATLAPQQDMVAGRWRYSMPEVINVVPLVSQARSQISSLASERPSSLWFRKLHGIM